MDFKFPKTCLICHKDFEIKMLGNIPFPTSKGHEECNKIIAAEEEKRRQAEILIEDEKRRIQSLNESFVDGAIDWTQRGWDQWVENDENKAIMEFLREWEYNDKGLVLSGSPGIGKTHLLAATAIRMHSRRWEKFKFIRFARWADQIRASELPIVLAMTKELEQANSLFIDDLGANILTDFLEDKLCQILDYRLEFKKVTFISTNISLEEGHKLFSARLMSRILGLCKWIDIKRIKNDWRSK